MRCAGYPIIAGRSAAGVDSLCGISETLQGSDTVSRGGLGVGLLFRLPSFVHLGYICSDLRDWLRRILPGRPSRFNSGGRGNLTRQHSPQSGSLMPFTESVVKRLTKSPGTQRQCSLCRPSPLEGGLSQLIQTRPNSVGSPEVRAITRTSSLLH